MSPGFGDQAIGADSPFFISANSDSLSGTSGACVGSDESPMISGAISVDLQAIHLHNQIRKGLHEILRRGCDRRPSDGWHPVIDFQRSILSVKGSDSGRIVTAPGCGVARGEVIQFVEIHSMTYQLTLIFCGSGLACRGW